MPALNKKRVISGAIIAPWTSVIVLFLSGLSDGNSPQMDTLIYLIALITSYLGTLILGMPLVYFLGRFKCLNLPILVLSGSVLGIFVWYLFSIFLGYMLSSSVSFELKNIIGGIFFGSIISICFGLIAGITIHSSGTASQPLT